MYEETFESADIVAWSPDRRIKAVNTVSMVNIGQMFRNGWENNIKDADAIPVRDMGADARRA